MAKDEPQYWIIHKGGTIKCDSKKQHDKLVKYLLDNSK